MKTALRRAMHDEKPPQRTRTCPDFTVNSRCGEPPVTPMCEPIVHETSDALGGMAGREGGRVLGKPFSVAGLRESVRDLLEGVS
jgi:hypothetical protein